MKMKSILLSVLALTITSSAFAANFECQGDEYGYPEHYLSKFVFKQVSDNKYEVTEFDSSGKQTQDRTFDATQTGSDLKLHYEDGRFFGHAIPEKSYHTDDIWVDLSAGKGGDVADFDPNKIDAESFMKFQGVYRDITDLTDCH